MFSTENDALTAQITQLREEVVNLKTLLLAHKDCPVTQQQGIHGAFMSQVVEPYNPQMNPYGMAAPMPNQQVMAGQGVQRRFSWNEIKPPPSQQIKVEQADMSSPSHMIEGLDDPFFPQSQGD
jgi:hypothetical protein